jgi:hypothetical protein
VGRRRAIRLAAVLIYGFSVGAPAAAQEALLERWTVDVVSNGWSPRWSPSRELAKTRTTPKPRVALSLGAQALRLRSELDGSESSMRLDLWHPLSRSFGLRVAAASDAWRTRRGGRTLLDIPRSHSAATGLEVRQSLDRLGDLELYALAGWDGGAGGEGGLVLSGDRHALRVTGWRASARESVVFFPADSLREVGLSQLVSGARLEARVAVPVGGLVLHTSGIWEDEFMGEGSRAVDEAFLIASPGGDSRTRGLKFGAGLGFWTLEGGYRSREIDLESPLYRSGSAAGRLFYGTLDLRQWTAGVSRRFPGSRWSVAAGREHVTGELSTRVETWPFLSIWETLSVQAYRLRGQLDARGTWVGLRRTPTGPTGWTWGVAGGRYEMTLDRSSWFVTSLGFGRTDVEQTSAGVDPAVVLAAELGRTFRLGPSLLRLDLGGGLPVRSERVGIDSGTVDRGVAGQGPAGYGAVRACWVW